MLSRQKRLENQLMVQVMRRRNIRNIDLGIRQQFLGRLIHMPGKDGAGEFWKL